VVRPAPAHAPVQQELIAGLVHRFGQPQGLLLAPPDLVGVGAPHQAPHLYERMLSKHRGLAITTDQRFRFVSLMSLAADDADLPSDPEFRSVLVAYLEWGTRLALANSQPGATVVEHAPVPRWGWGEAPPYPP
jgi:hypothetical protein